MSRDPVQELRAKLLGQGSYARSGPPDLEALTYLAPVLGDEYDQVEALEILAAHLPDALLPRALELAAGIENDGWRGRAADALRKPAQRSGVDHPVLRAPSPAMTCAGPG